MKSVHTITFRMLLPVSILVALSTAAAPAQDVNLPLDLVAVAEPCPPAAFTDTPNLGSGEAPCNKASRIYKDEGTTFAITVDLKDGGRCEAELWKNGDARNGFREGGEKCADTGDAAGGAATCRNVKTLVLVCNGSGSEVCKARITQIQYESDVKKPEGDKPK